MNFFNFSKISSNLFDSESDAAYKGDISVAKPSMNHSTEFIKSIAALILKPNFGPCLINPAWQDPVFYTAHSSHLIYSPEKTKKQAVMCYSFGLVNECNVISPKPVKDSYFKGINIYPFSVEAERTFCFLAEALGFDKSNPLAISNFNEALSITSRWGNVQQSSRKQYALYLFLI